MLIFLPCFYLACLSSVRLLCDAVEQRGALAVASIERM